jgi:hypothetical protein
MQPSSIGHCWVDTLVDQLPQLSAAMEGNALAGKDERVEGLEALV